MNQGLGVLTGKEAHVDILDNLFLLNLIFRKVSSVLETEHN